jgi:hypothetical protein
MQFGLCNPFIKNVQMENVLKMDSLEMQGRSAEEN